MENILYILAYLIGFWYIFILVMGLYRAHLAKRLSTVAIILAMPAIIAGYVLDIFTNIFIATLIFIELPQELLLTSRFKRYSDNNYGWRSATAEYICTNLLDVFDPSGDHC